ncbi:MAG: lamin tail domain-containing protein, partial [Candidatus Marinimicrobia bacterium]|nr:lamin tail domain-containing protein [Candidatus Neomarinimicrobiota bacterium]
MISEVMIDPQGTDSPNEFVELTNISDEPVNLTGWRLGDLNSTDELSSDSLILWPGEYAVIFEGDYIPDSGAYAGLLPPGTHILFVDDNSIGNGLANSADSLFLRDSSGAIVDRMGWSEAPPEGFTLEKVLLGDCDMPGNWRSSLQPLGTPGNINSVSGQIIDLSLDSVASRLVSAPNYFELTATVTNRGLGNAAAQLVGPGGQLAVVPELAVGATFTVIFDWSG